MKYLVALIVVISLIGFIGYVFNPSRIDEAVIKNYQYIHAQQQKTLSNNH